MIIIRAVFTVAVLALAGVLVVALSGHLWGTLPIRSPRSGSKAGFTKNWCRGLTLRAARTPNQDRRFRTYGRLKPSRCGNRFSHHRRRSRNSGMTFLLAPLFLPLLFTAVLWGFTLEPTT